MAGDVEARLADLGIKLPEPAIPAANYVPFVVTDNQVFIAGQIPFWNGEVKFRGVVGEDYGIEEGQQAARTCALNLLAQLKVACNDDLNRMRRCIKLGVFVNCPAGFDRQPEVANGASDLMVEVFGDAGRHARFAVGAGSLPRNVAVEVDGIFEIG
jgi:enamine deaminase RidA (YjgF/YER057c/UK114 family)